MEGEPVGVQERIANPYDRLERFRVGTDAFLHICSYSLTGKIVALYPTVLGSVPSESSMNSVMIDALV